MLEKSVKVHTLNQTAFLAMKWPTQSEKKTAFGATIITGIKYRYIYFFVQQLC